MYICVGTYLKTHFKYYEGGMYEIILIPKSLLLNNLLAYNYYNKSFINKLLMLKYLGYNKQL